MTTPVNADVPGNADLPIGDIGRQSGERRSRIIHCNSGFGWHSRGYLPHFDGDEVTQHVTFHLADSLPRHIVERLNESIKALPPEKQDAERRRNVEAWMDAGHGSCLLREPALAALVEEALLHFDAQRYRLLEWVVMPNHVHVLFQPINGWLMSKIVTSWKKFTARRICDSHSGDTNLPNGDPSHTIWHREYWDRYIRNARHFQKAVEYIRLNPVKAGLVSEAEEWRWSSACVCAEIANQYANQEIGVPGTIGGPR